MGGGYTGSKPQWERQKVGTLERFAGSNQTAARGTELLVRAHNAAFKLTVGLRHLGRITGVSWLEAARSLTPCYVY